MTKSQKPKDDRHPLDELWSALHKSVRRGLKEEALHFAVLITEYFEHPQNALWNYLTVIAYEDVGLANVWAPSLIETYRGHYANKDFIKKGRNHLPLAQAVEYLCSCKKSRLVDDSATVVWGEIELDGKRMDIPSYAIDHHTKRGRELNRWNVWYSEGCKLTNEANISNPYTERANKLRRRPKRTKIKKKDPSTTLDSYVQ